MPGGMEAAAAVTALAGLVSDVVAPPAVSQTEGTASGVSLAANMRWRAFDTRYFCVLCPWHQSELVQLVFRIPGTTVPEALHEIERGLSSLRLAFARRVVPTTPQLFEGSASVVLGGNWHEDYGDAVLVLDFRAFAGPVYAKTFPQACGYDDLRREAAASGVREFSVFLFGSMQPLAPHTDFRALHGVVAQFRPVGSLPMWSTDFASRLHSVDAWSGPADTGEDSGPAVALMSGTTVCVHRELMGQTPTDTGDMLAAAARLVGRSLSDVTCAFPTSQHFHNASVSGVSCRNVVAVIDGPAALEENGAIVVFLDARQLGLAPAFVRLRSSVVEVGYLARQAGIFRLPAGFHLSLAHAAPATRENHIYVRAGDVITLGFRSDIDSDNDAGSDRDSADTGPHAPGSDSSTEHTDDPSTDRESTQSSPVAEPVDEVHSLRSRRSRTRSAPCAGSSDFYGPARIDSLAVGQLQDVGRAAKCGATGPPLLAVSPRLEWSLPAQTVPLDVSDSAGLSAVLFCLRWADHFWGDTVEASRQMCKWQVRFKVHAALWMSALLGTSASLSGISPPTWADQPTSLFFLSWAWFLGGL